MKHSRTSALRPLEVSQTSQKTTIETFCDDDLHGQISTQCMHSALTRYGGYKRRSMDDEKVAPHSFTWIRRERSLPEN